MRFLAILGMQVRWLRGPLAILCLAALVAPSLGLGSGEGAIIPGEMLIERGEIVGILVAVLAVVAGIVVAYVSWSMDERVGHVYARTLPIDRARFLQLRALAGLLLLAVVATAIAMGLAVGFARVTAPPGIRPYPAWTGLRALAVMALVFAITFALQYGIGRRGRRAVLIGVGLLLAVSYVESQSFPGKRHPVSGLLRSAFLSEASPFSVLFSRWRTVDL